MTFAFSRLTLIIFIKSIILRKLQNNQSTMCYLSLLFFSEFYSLTTFQLKLKFTHFLLISIFNFYFFFSIPNNIKVHVKNETNCLVTFAFLSGNSLEIVHLSCSNWSSYDLKMLDDCLLVA